MPVDENGNVYVDECSGCDECDECTPPLTQFEDDESPAEDCRCPDCERERETESMDQRLDAAADRVRDRLAEESVDMPRANFYDNLTVYWCPGCDTFCHRDSRRMHTDVVICKTCEKYVHACLVKTQRGNAPNWDGRAFGRTIRPRADTWDTVEHNFKVVSLTRVRKIDPTGNFYMVRPVEDVIAEQRQRGTY